MKQIHIKALLLICVFFSVIQSRAQIVHKAATLQVGNTSSNSQNTAAALQIDDTARGFLLPRMTTDDRDAIANPRQGLTIYNSTTNCIEWYQDASWYNACGTNEQSSNGSAIITSINCNTASTGNLVFSIPVSGVTQDISVTVVKTGNYSISCTNAGITFSASGYFSTTGNHTIQLLATGVPTQVGTFSFNLNSTPSCSFSRNITGLVPTVPSNPVAFAGNTRATVSFNPSSSSGQGQIQYTVMSTPSGIVATGNSSPIVVNNLINGTAYTFSVAASNNAGYSAYSGPSNQVTPQATKPDPPVIVSGIAGDGTATIAFLPPSNDGGAPITGYVITAAIGNITMNTTSSPVTISGLTNGTSYTFYVVAKNSLGTSDPSSVIIIPKTVPNPPVIAAVEQNTQTSVTVEITPPNTNDEAIESYTITATSSTSQTITLTSQSTSILLTGLTAGETYTFTAIATNSTGDSLSSEPFGPFIMSTTGAYLTNYYNGVTTN